MEQDAAILNRALARCARHGVGTVVISLECSSGQPEHALDLLLRTAAAHPLQCLTSFGFSPPTRPEDGDAMLSRLPQATLLADRLLQQGRLSAIGEVGLDYYWPEQTAPDASAWRSEYRRIQAAIFRHWIQYAVTKKLPLVVHEREALPDTRQLLDESGIAPARVMFHCCSAAPDEAALLAEKGYRISVPSSVVFRTQFQEIARAVPLDSLLIETDSPYHSPLPGLWKQCRDSGGENDPKTKAAAGTTERFNRMLSEELPDLVMETDTADGWTPVPASEYFLDSKARYRNEPVLVRFAAKAISAIKGLDYESTCVRLQANARMFFGGK